MPRSFVFLSILIALLLPGTPEAAPLVFEMDPAGSEVTFVLDATLHEVRGTLPLTGAELRFDSRGGAAAGEMRVDALGARTGNSGRDKKLHAEVLESARFPLMTYRVSAVTGELPEAGRGELRLAGSLSLHGAEHALTIPAVVDVAGDRVTVTARFQVPYVAWGLADPSVFVLRVAKVVDVTVRVAGRVSRVAAPDARPPEGAQ